MDSEYGHLFEKIFKSRITDRECSILIQENQIFSTLKTNISHKTFLDEHPHQSG